MNIFYLFTDSVLDIYIYKGMRRRKRAPVAVKQWGSVVGRSTWLPNGRCLMQPTSNKITLHHNSGTKRRHKGAPPLVGESELKHESELKLLPYKFKSFNN
jgi:hypothetical protein